MTTIKSSVPGQWGDIHVNTGLAFAEADERHAIARGDGWARALVFLALVLVLIALGLSLYFRWQHWYIVFCTRPDIWLKGKWAEGEIGYAIHHDESGPVYLEDMEPKFEAMRAAGIPATEHIPQQRFWAQAKKIIKINVQQSVLPCECTEGA